MALNIVAASAIVKELFTLDAEGLALLVQARTDGVIPAQFATLEKELEAALKFVQMFQRFSALI